MSFQIRILPVAIEDRRSIFRYIEQRSEQGAKNWEAAYERSLSRLEENPLICGLAPEAEHFEFDLRQIQFRTRRGLTYRIIFRIDGNCVTIYRLRGPGQAPLRSRDLPGG